VEAVEDAGRSYRVMRRGRIAAIALGLLAVAYGVFFYLSHSNAAGSPVEMIAALPQTGATLAYIDVEAIRKAGLLRLTASPKIQDADYRSFIDSTGFDYERDLDAVAASFTGSGNFFVVRGRFDWSRVRSYAQQHGGGCRGELCRTTGSVPQRWVSFWRINSKLMALASSPSDSAALDITPRKLKGSAVAPSRPVWVSVDPSALASITGLPAGTQSFTSPLASAERVVFSAAPAGDQFRLYLDVTSRSETGAGELQKRLQDATDLLNNMLEREHLKPNEADMSGLLAAGKFRRSGRQVLGEWPIHKKLIESIAGGKLS
jgi:hypothetical protein